MGLLGSLIYIYIYTVYLRSMEPWENIALGRVNVGNMESWECWPLEA